MEGLEAREQLSSEMQSHSRLDATFAAHPATAWLEGLQQQRKFIPIAEALSFIGSGHTPYLHDVSQGDVGFITVECIDALNFNDGSLKRITKEQYETEFQSKRVTAGSVVCTIKRRICKGYAFLEEPEQPLAINQDVALLKPKPGWRPAYLAAYLSSKVGQTFADRLKTEQMNPYLSVDNLRTLPICELSGGFQDALTQLIQRAGRVKASSRDLYAQAETLLLRELGLDNLDTVNELTYTRGFKEVETAARFDAQYFHPKAQRAMAIMGRSGQCIGDVAPLAKRYFSPERGKPFEYIEIGSVGGNGQANSETVNGEDAPSRAQWIVQNGDVITSTVRPIRRLTALIEPEQDGFVCSSGFAVLAPESVSPELLTVYLRLPIVCEILDLHTTASLYPAISAEDLLSIPITLPGEEVSAKVVVGVQQAHGAKQEAKRLLEVAKRAVEVAIEDSEGAALALLAAQSEPSGPAS